MTQSCFMQRIIIKESETSTKACISEHVEPVYLKIIHAAKEEYENREKPRMLKELIE